MKTKRPPPKQCKPGVGTYFLAKKSGLFRPGAELILAAALPQKQCKRPMKNKA